SEFVRRIVQEVADDDAMIRKIQSLPDSKTLADIERLVFDVSLMPFLKEHGTDNLSQWVDLLSSRAVARALDGLTEHLTARQRSVAKIERSRLKQAHAAEVCSPETERFSRAETCIERRMYRSLALLISSKSAAKDANFMSLLRFQT